MTVRALFFLCMGLIVLNVWGIGHAEAGEYVPEGSAASRMLIDAAAIRAKAQFQLTLSIGGTGAGATEPAAGVYSYEEGSFVEIKATATSGSMFEYWEGDLGEADPSESTIHVLMDQDRSLTAVFTLIPTHTLTVSVQGNGTTNPAPGIHSFEEGTTQHIEAMANPGAQFAYWEGDIGENIPTLASMDILMDQDRSVNAVFVTGDWVLTVQATGNGTTDPAPGVYGYADGAEICISARLVSGGDAFSQWTGDLAPGANSADRYQCVTMNQHRTITAGFVPGDWTLTLTQTGDGAGSLYPGTGVFSYLDGQFADVSEYSPPGVYFGGWSGDYSGYEPRIQVPMDDNKSVEAFFDTSGYTLTLAIEGPGSLNFDAGVHRFAAGSALMLFPTSIQAGYVFSHWSGNLPDGTDPETAELPVVLDRNRSITAHFVLETRTLTLIIEGEGVTHPAGSPAPGTTHAYLPWTHLVLDVDLSGPDWAFCYWGGNTGTGSTTVLPLEVNMNIDRTIIAYFYPAEWRLTINHTGNGSTYPPPGTYGFMNGRVFYVRAIPVNGGEAFVRWTGDLPPEADPRSFSLRLPMEQNRTLTAEFAPGDYTLTVHPVEGGGMVETSPSPGVYAFGAGQRVPLEVKPAPGVFWGGWTGSITTYELTWPLVMDEDKEVTPHSTPSGYVLTTNWAGAYGSVSPLGVTGYTAGATPTIHAIEPGWGLFDHWSGDLPAGVNPVEPDPIILMDQDRAITANFVAGDWYLYIQVIGNGTTNPPPKLYWHREGDMFEVTACPEADSRLLYWSGDVPEGQAADSLTLTGTMTKNTELIAVFVSNAVIVPDVVGLSRIDAEAVLAYEGFVVGDVTEIYDDAVPASQVMAQDPLPETVTTYGATVNLVVSLGVCYAMAPYLAGLTQAEAENVLDAANLTLGTVTGEVSEEVPEGLVIRHAPEYGLIAECGSRVDLVVSLGCYSQVPDLTGFTQAEAETILLATQLNLGLVTGEISEEVPEGLVIRQDPASGSTVVCRDSVNVVISLGCYTQVPEVTGFTQAATEAALIAAHLNLGMVTGEMSEEIPEGVVIRQEPAFGVAAVCEDPVNVVISLGCYSLVPDLTGLTRTAAQALLTAAHLTLGAVTEEISELTPEGLVIRQEPAHNARVVCDSAVDFVVSLGGAMEGMMEGEGRPEGSEEGEGAFPEGEGASQEGEGTPEEGEGETVKHTADPDGDHKISLSELLNVIQYYNSGGFHCDADTEDGYAAGPGDENCTPHNSDYRPRDWRINLSELLRLIQFYNSGGYRYCPDETVEDGFCPAAPPVPLS